VPTTRNSGCWWWTWPAAVAVAVAVAAAIDRLLAVPVLELLARFGWRDLPVPAAIIYYCRSRRYLGNARQRQAQLPARAAGVAVAS
jgi:hypothetical protein